MNLDVNFVLADDYDTAVNQLRGLLEPQIEERQRNPNMLPEQYRAMAFVLGEKTRIRHSDVLKWTKITALLSAVGILTTIVVALYQR